MHGTHEWACMQSYAPLGTGRGCRQTQGSRGGMMTVACHTLTQVLVLVKEVVTLTGVQATLPTVCQHLSVQHGVPECGTSEWDATCELKI